MLVWISFQGDILNYVIMTLYKEHLLEIQIEDFFIIHISILK